jgi:hypothetical protein
MPAGTMIAITAGAVVLAALVAPLVHPLQGSAARPAAAGAVDAAAIEAGAGARSPAGQPTVEPATTAGPAGAAPAAPRLRAPTPGQPLSLWVGGDEPSLEMGLGVEHLAEAGGLFTVAREARGPSGLARTDGFDWPAHLGTVDADVAVVMFAGDDRALAADGAGPAALAGYRRRVAEAMDALRPPAGDRLVMWVGAPVAEPGAPSAAAAINAVYASEAARRPWVRYVDALPFLADPFGRYAADLANADGRTRAVRGEGGRLTPAGGTRLALAVYGRLATLVDLRAGPVPFDPAEAAPPSVVERDPAVVLAG